MKIELGKQYRTRDGREVRIYAVDGCNGHRVHGAIYGGKDHGWQHRAWFSDGRMHGNNSDCDLIEVKPRIQRRVWVNVYPTWLDSDVAWASKSRADEGAAPDRIACVEINIDVDEDHGL